MGRNARQLVVVYTVIVCYLKSKENTFYNTPQTHLYDAAHGEEEIRFLVGERPRGGLGGGRLDDREARLGERRDDLGGVPALGGGEGGKEELVELGCRRGGARTGCELYCTVLVLEYYIQWVIAVP